MSGERGVQRSIKSRQIGMQLLFARITNAAGVWSVSGEDSSIMTLTDNGAGDVTITLAVAAEKALKAFIQPIADADTLAVVKATTTSTVRILTFTANTGAALDTEEASFDIMIMFHDNPTNF